MAAAQARNTAAAPSANFRQWARPAEMIKGGLGNITRITRSVNLGTLIQATSTVNTFIGKGLQFTLNDLPSVAEFTALFDQYKIEKVVVHMIPFSTGSLMTQNVSFPLITVIDFDDAATPTTEDFLLQYANNSITHANQEVHRTLIPRVAAAVYDAGGLFNGYANQQTWIDAASPAVVHYGFKAGIGPAFGTVGVAGWNIYADYHLAFRATR